MQARARRAVYALLTRTLTVPDPLTARPYTGWSYSYGARGAWPNSNPTLTLALALTLSLPSRQLKAGGLVRL
jgi:hypothetical protein